MNATAVLARFVKDLERKAAIFREPLEACDVDRLLAAAIQRAEQLGVTKDELWDTVEQASQLQLPDGQPALTEAATRRLVERIELHQPTDTALVRDQVVNSLEVANKFSSALFETHTVTITATKYKTNKQRQRAHEAEQTPPFMLLHRVW